MDQEVHDVEEKIRNPALEDLLHYRVQRLASKMSLITSREVLSASGVHVGEWRLICLLAKNGSLNHSVISRRLALDLGRTSHLMKAAEKKGLARRRSDPSDGRASIFEPTAKALEIFDRLWPEACGIADDFHDLFSKGELEQFNRFLDRAIAFANSKIGD